MNFYPEELDAISSLCKLLDGWVKGQSGRGVYIGESITLYSLDGGEKLGSISDEIGGSLCFTPTVAQPTPDPAE